MFAVNLHILRGCNYECDYCFHSNPQRRGDADRSFLPPLGPEDYDLAINLLAQEGCSKINIAGGEPFLVPELVSSILKQAKQYDIYTSVITNGALATVCPDLDMIGVSIDSFDADTNLRIGRGHLKFKKVLDMRNEAKRMGVMFKVNTVVNQQNVREDFNAHMQLLDVDRWKALQVLNVERENGNSFDPFAISDAEFCAFLDRHGENQALIAESNEIMRTSYLILDEHLRFLDGMTKSPFTESILRDNSAISTALDTLDCDALRARKGNFYLD